MTTLLQLETALSDRYRIDREIGAGGMATVYLAHDLKHDRDIAIKVLHPDLGAALGADRFLAEIKTTAKLQHPHILPLLDSGDAGGLLFYVMPLVEGETLRARLEREQQLPIDVAVRIATETAGALDYAHRHGVIHRDIKPENILLHDGRAVVADFGIALAVSAASGPRMTQTGLSLGTPQYMAPEQAMGERQIDGRADVYALGAVLYEMLIGEPPFTGATVQAIVAKVLTERPTNPTAVRDTIPRHIEATALKALAKLPADRFATPAQFADALAHPEIMSASAATNAGTQATHASNAPSGLRRHLAASPAIYAALIATAAAAAVGWLRHDRASPQLQVGVVLAEIPGIATGANAASRMGVSGDGSLLAHMAWDSTRSPRLALRSLTDPDAGVTFVSTGPANNPAFSPNGQSLAFLSSGSQVIQIFQLSSRTVRTLGMGYFARGLTWTDDSTIVYASRGELRRWRVSRKEPEVLGRGADSTELLFPFAVSANLVLLQIGQGPSSEIATLSLSDNRVTRLGIHGSRPAYIDGGIVLYLNDGRLWGVPVDESTLKIKGEARIISRASGSSRVSSYASGRNGALVVARGSGDRTLDLVVVDRAGKARSLLNEERVFRWPRYSPDGRRIAVSVQSGANGGDLYMVRTGAGPTDAGTLERITSDSVSLESEWDPDGRSLIFSRRSRRGEPPHLARISADGSGKPALLLTRPSAMYESAITPDHKTLIWREDAPSTARDILSAPLDSPNVVRPIRNSAFDERGFSLSPDGKWLAFTSNEAGSSEVYICRVEPNGAHWRVSRRGGSEPRWARTGELFYRNGDSVFVSRVTLGTEPTIGTPSLVFTGQYTNAPFEPLWDVSPDARQFVMVREPPGAGGTQLVLMVNWIESWRAGRGSK